MRKELLEILCCPEDKGLLELSDEVVNGDEIESGKLTCSECRFVYPIESGIPNLLPQEFHAGS